MANDFKVIVEGDYAGFNRPELKTERVSSEIGFFSELFHTNIKKFTE